MTWTRLRGALIRFGYTFILAFLAQPLVHSFFDRPFKFTAQEAYAALLAAFVYAVKKYVFPDTVL